MVDDCAVDRVEHVGDVTNRAGGGNCEVTVLRTYRAIDACGNSAVCTQTIRWREDTIFPTIVSAPLGGYLGCNALAPDVSGQFVVQDNCGAPSVVLAFALTNTVGCTRTTTHGYRITDACGNSITKEVVFTTSVPAGPPVISCPPILYVLPDAAGAYAVPDVLDQIVISSPCDTTLRQDPPHSTIFATDWSAGDSIEVTATDLCGNETTCTIALTNASVVGDTVWHDLDHDGVNDTNEPPVAGVIAILRNAAGVEIGRTVTDTNGTYEFHVDPLSPEAGGDADGGFYTVAFEAPENYEPTVSGIDSAAGADYVTPSFHLPAGGSNLDQDLGLFDQIDVFGYVWEDLGLDGSDNDNLRELGLNGVDVTLLRIESDGSTTEVARTTTGVGPNGEQGYYAFEDLEPGTYRVFIDEDDIPDHLTRGTDPFGPEFEVMSGTTPSDVDGITNFGYAPQPVAVALVAVEATEGALSWTVGLEQDVLGYQVIDLDTGETVNQRLILAKGGGAYALDLGEGNYAVEAVHNDLSVDRVAVVTHYPEVDAAPLGVPTEIVTAEHGAANFTTSDETRSYFVTGIVPGAKVLDVTNPNRPVRLRVEWVETDDGTAAYFSYPAGAAIQINP